MWRRSSRLYSRPGQTVVAGFVQVTLRRTLATAHVSTSSAAGSSLPTFEGTEVDSTEQFRKCRISVAIAGNVRIAANAHRLMTAGSPFKVLV